VGSKVILCVDDESLVLNSLKTQLRTEFGSEYEYETSESASEALEILDELVDEGLDVIVIVSDWLMPGIKGDEFLVRVHQKFPQTAKIMLTGQADEAAIERAKVEANLDHFLEKPWSKEDLISAVKAGMQKLSD
jgi:CheY-like chemotaxis protein